MRNPSANFGEISRLVGMEWKKLCEVERKAFEDRAHVLNQEAAERTLLGLDAPAGVSVGWAGRSGCGRCWVGWTLVLRWVLGELDAPAGVGVGRVGRPCCGGCRVGCTLLLG